MRRCRQLCKMSRENGRQTLLLLSMATLPCKGVYSLQPFSAVSGRVRRPATDGTTAIATATASSRNGAWGSSTHCQDQCRGGGCWGRCSARPRHTVHGKTVGELQEVLGFQQHRHGHRHQRQHRARSSRGRSSRSNTGGDGTQSSSAPAIATTTRAIQLTEAATAAVPPSFDARDVWGGCCMPVYLFHQRPGKVRWLLGFWRHRSLHRPAVHCLRIFRKQQQQQQQQQRHKGLQRTAARRAVLVGRVHD